MRSGCLSQMASGSQLHAIEAMRTQTIYQQCMPSQVEQDETSSAGNRLPSACNKVCVLVPVCIFHAYQCCLLSMPADHMPVWQVMISKDHERLAIVNSTVNKDQVDVVGDKFCIFSILMYTWQTMTTSFHGKSLTVYYSVLRREAQLCVAWS